MQIDRALATRLATVLKLVMHGKTLPVAAAEAGVSAHEIDRIMKALERELWNRARDESDEGEIDPYTAATAPAKPAPKHKAPKKSAPVERTLPKLEPRVSKAAKAGLALIAYADGGSRGNPGEAACAAFITTDDGHELLRRAKRLGKTTNNVAEYEAVLLALDLCKELGAAHVTLRVDSELVARQIEAVQSPPGPHAAPSPRHSPQAHLRTPQRRAHPSQEKRGGRRHGQRLPRQQRAGLAGALHARVAHARS
jgi:ribonuclease HI